MKQCPTTRQFTREVSLGPSPDMQQHLESCASCRETWSATVSFIETAKQLPDGIPSPAHLQQMEKDLVAAARARPPRRDRRSVVYFVAAAAALLVLCVSTVVFLNNRARPDAVEATSQHRGAIIAESGARYTHLITRDGDRQNEIIRLIDGAITLRVKPLETRERFRVVTDDAAVEVRGTEFSVTASANHLVSVVVTHGKVLVAPDTGDEVLLTAGGSWRRTESASSAKMSPSTTQPSNDNAASALPVAHPSTSPRQPLKTSRTTETKPVPAKKETPDNADTFFKEGWSLYKTGANKDAARVFDKAVSQTGPVPNAEDLYFWRAAAHFKAGDTVEADNAFRDFLTCYPNAARLEEIRAMYGWHLLRQGHLDAAAVEFEAAQKSRVGRVRDSAGQGLNKIRSTRAGVE